MKGLFCIILFASVFSQISSENNILILNDNNFEEAISKYSELLVEFDTPWCRKCKRFVKAYEEAAKELVSRSKPLYLAKINAMESPAMVEKYKISKFPTFLFFRNGESSEYTFGFEKEDFITYMEEKQNPSFSHFHSANELKSSLSSVGSMVVCYFPSEDCKEYKEWHSYASSIEDIPFTFITSEDIAEEMGVEAPSIYFYITEENKVQFTGEMSSFKKWFITTTLPPVIPFNEFYSSRIFSNNHDIQLHLLYFSSTKEDENMTALEKVGFTFRGKIFVIQIPAEKSLLLSFFGVKTDQMPCLMLYNTVSNKKYQFYGVFTEENVNQFVINYHSGLLLPYYKSQDEIKQTDLIYQLVRNDFNDVAFSPTENVLVLFYLPWCREYQAFLPTYKRLSEVYRDDPNVVIAMMDMSVNDLEEMTVHESNTIRFYKAGGEGNEFVTFEGERTVENIEEFINENRVYVEKADQDQDQDQEQSEDEL